MKKPKTTCYMYKCRMCGKTFSNTESGSGREHATLVDAILNIRVNNQLPVSMTDIHNCKRNQFGIGDLVGCISK